ncbi:hypothetical protein GA047_13405 [Vibrio cholerae]|nr:hypothetical protein [Vibrio cholerae]
MIKDRDLLSKYISQSFLKHGQIILDDKCFKAEEIEVLKSIAEEVIPKDWLVMEKATVLLGNGWKVSYKEPHQFTVWSSDIPETALCIDGDVFVLNGDHRSSFEGSALRAPSEMKDIFNSLKEIS